MNQRIGHNHLTVLADLVAKRGLFATPWKEALVRESFVEELLRSNGHSKAIIRCHKHERGQQQGSER
jgi:hypothetical protein